MNMENNFLIIRKAIVFLCIITMLYINLGCVGSKPSQTTSISAKTSAVTTTNPKIKQTQDAIKAVAKQLNIDVVLTDGVAYASNAINITDLVSQQMVSGGTAYQAKNIVGSRFAVVDFRKLIGEEPNINSYSRPKVIALDKSGVAESSSAVNLGIDQIKNQCSELGFKLGSKRHGECVMDLLK